MKRYIVFILFPIIVILLTGCNPTTHAHTPGEWTIQSEATCVNDGLQRCYCTECGEIVAEEPIKASHNFEVTAIAPTCTEKGYDRLECKVCGISTMNNFKNAIGHTTTKYDVINYDATATADGSVYGTCSLCREYLKITLTGSSEKIAKAFYGKKISVIGDSISTYVNISNGAAAQTSNSNISKNSLYYFKAHNEALGVNPDDTWWMRTINALGADLLVNNSDSGGYIRDSKSNGNKGAYYENAVNLHDNTGADAGTNPDMVFVYLGTNDFGKYYNSLGDVSSIDFEKLGEKCEADYMPVTVAEAYAILIYKIKTAYPGVEIYCLNVLDSTLWKTKSAYLSDFNARLGEIAERLGATVVDIYNESGIKNDENFEKYIPSNDGDDTPNTLHPNAEGFKLISDVLLRVIANHSKYFPDIYKTNE